jgi:S-adenosylmethionine:tRNA ribosyltransferase-isomerase
MRTADFDFALPPELIAQFPAAQRDHSRLLVLHRRTGELEHKKFAELKNYLRPGDVLVLNNSRVIKARLRGTNAQTGGAFEILLLEENAPNDWWAMMKPGKRAKVGTRIQLTQHASRNTPSITATVTATNDEGHRRLQFSGPGNVLDALDQIGELPLPPYIRRPTEPRSSRREEAHTNSAELSQSLLTSAATDDQRYQTVYAQPAGSVAAPTAGLHFTEDLLAEIRALGVETHFVTLHVGLGTFAPVKAETIAGHVMHEERYEVSAATAAAVNVAKREGRRVIAVGTTSVRVLESSFGVPPSGGSARENSEPPEGETPNQIRSGTGRTKIFIYPPRDFKIVDALLTNFHLPCSTLLMLVSAFAAPGELCGRESVLHAYAAAVRERYRFFSYGDAMFLL